MYACHVHSGDEDVGISCERLGCEHTAIREAPDPDTLGIDVVARLQVSPRCDNITILRVSSASASLSITEAFAVANAAAVVDTHDDVSHALQPLICGVGRVVKPHVMIAEQHLTHRSSMDKNDGWTAFSCFDVL